MKILASNFTNRLNAEGIVGKCKIRSKGLWRVHITYFYKFGTLHISETVEARYLKFGTIIDPRTPAVGGETPTTPTLVPLRLKLVPLRIEAGYGPVVKHASLLYRMFVRIYW